MSIGTAFAEDAQRALFQRRTVEQVLIQPGTGSNVVAALAQHVSVGASAVHALAGIGRNLAFPGLRVNAHDPGTVHIIYLLPVAAETAQVINAHLAVRGHRPFRAQCPGLRVVQCQTGGQVVRRRAAGIQGAHIAQKQRYLSVSIGAGIGDAGHLKHLAGPARQRDATEAHFIFPAGITAAHEVQPVPHHEPGVGAHGIGIVLVLFHHHVQVQLDRLRFQL